MAWSLPWARKAATPAGPDLDADDAWAQHVSTLAAHGIPEPGSAVGGQPRRPATEADLQALYGVAPSFADLLPWVEYLPDSKRPANMAEVSAARSADIGGVPVLGAHGPRRLCVIVVG